MKSALTMAHSIPLLNSGHSVKSTDSNIQPHLPHPHSHPKSNGKDEKGIQIAKNLLKKTKADKQDPHLAHLDYRNTPLDGLPSPAQLLMGRRTKTRLPTIKKLLQPGTMEGPRDTRGRCCIMNDQTSRRCMHTIRFIKALRFSNQWSQSQSHYMMVL